MHRDQLRVARTGADQIDRAGLRPHWFWEPRAASKMAAAR